MNSTLLDARVEAVLLSFTLGGAEPVIGPSPVDIARGIRELSGGSDSFAVLTRDMDPTFVQVGGGGHDAYDLEVRLGENDRDHMRCTEPHLSQDRVVEAFIAYASNTPEWTRRFEWEPVDHSGARTLADLATEAGMTPEQYLVAGDRLAESDEVPGEPERMTAGLPEPGWLSTPAANRPGWVILARHSESGLLFLAFGLNLAKRVGRLRQDYRGHFEIVAKVRGTRHQKESLHWSLLRAAGRDRSLQGGWFPDTPQVRRCLYSLRQGREPGYRQDPDAGA